MLLRVAHQKSIFFVTQEDARLACKTLSQANPAAEIKPLSLHTFDGKPVSGVYTPSIHHHYRVLDSFRDLGLDAFESDIRLHERYLMERFICAGISFSGEPIQKDGYKEIHNPRLKPCEYQPQLKTLSLDIECDMTNELFSVGLAGCGCAEVLMIGAEIATEADSQINQAEQKTSIRWFENERALLSGLVSRINQLDPDVLIGWNLINFDLRILLARAAYHKISFSIGRGNQTPGWRDIKGEQEKGFIFIPGRVAIDGIDALKTATYRFPSFSLENVAQTLLGRGKKVEKDVDNRFAEIKHNFLHDKPKLAAYNLEDCQLVNEIFSHTQIIEFLILRSQMTGLEIDRVGGAVAAFTNLYLPRLHRAGYVAPNLPEAGGLGSPGGYVMDSRPGLYKNMLVLDFKSLYPSIIRTFKIDPMGLIEGLNNPDRSIEGFRGGKFDREKHFLPDIITDLWQQRDIAKRNHDSVRSQAIKILMNSFYGVLGAGNCRFYDSRLTSSITMRGHEIMQTTSKWIQKYGYQVIYGDTDSIFVWIGENASTQECTEIGKQLEQQINHRWKTKLEQEFNLECFLELEFETHFRRFLMPTIRGSESGSKKRYAGLIVTEGKEQLIFKGLENVRTDWTQLAQNFQSQLYDMIFHDIDPRDFIQQTVDDTLKGRRDDELVYRKQLRRRLDSYVKNVPPHVKAARRADAENLKHGKPLRYQHKGWINYLLTLNGPEPIEYHTSQIDYQTYVDKQLKPVADGILPFINLEFDAIISTQTNIF